MKKKAPVPECESLNNMIDQLTKDYGTEHSVVIAAMEWRDVWREQISTYNLNPNDEISFLAERLKIMDMMHKHLDVALHALPGAYTQSHSKQKKFKATIGDGLSEITAIEDTLKKQYTYAVRSLITSQKFNDKTVIKRPKINRPDVRIVFDDTKHPVTEVVNTHRSADRKSASTEEIEVYSPRKPR